MSKPIPFDEQQGAAAVVATEDKQRHREASSQRRETGKAGVRTGQQVRAWARRPKAMDARQQARNPRRSKSRWVQIDATPPIYGSTTSRKRAAAERAAMDAMNKAWR